ncbi:hypothetical protein ACLB2K_001809 [Fragaria x ananassa]
MGCYLLLPRILRVAIREREIQKGWEPLFVRSNRRVVRCICAAENCDFELCASRMQHEPTMQIKKYLHMHTCYRVHGNNAVREKGTKPPPKTKNELRANAAKIREDAKNKREEKKAATRAACKVAPTRGRPPKVAANNGRAASSKGKASSAPQASQSSQALTRSSVRNNGSARNTIK